jgi:hypothetical protein
MFQKKPRTPNKDKPVAASFLVYPELALGFEETPAFSA